MDANMVKTFCDTAVTAAQLRVAPGALSNALMEVVRMILPLVPKKPTVLGMPR